MKLVVSVATLITSSACDPIDNPGLLQGQGGQADGMGGQGGAASSSSSSSGQAGAGGQGGGASSSSSSSSSGQAGAGGQGGGASSSSSSSSGQAGAGGQGGAASSSSSSSSGQAGAGGQGGAGGGGICLDGQMQSCYDGPIGTENVGSCKAGTQTCVGGMWSTCMGDVVPVAEACDNIDNDCDGQVDEGNPGGGMACGPSIGGCQQRMACINGAVVCGGTFVGPAGVGAPGNPGTPAQPLSTIAAAQARAAIIGGDICLCDTPASGVSTYEENVTMVEAIGIYGGYNCVDWSRNISTYITYIKGTVVFSNGITAATTLDGLSVSGKDYTQPTPYPDSSTAISIFNSSPRLVNVKGVGGLADYSTGLTVGASNGNTASPTVIGGTYFANGNGYGIYGWQKGIVVSNAGGTFTNVTISPSGSSNYATGFECNGCSSTIVGGSINGGYSQKFTTGLYVTGNVTGFSITNTTINGGYANAGGGDARGIDFFNCTNAPTLTGVTIDGGTTLGFGTGILARGASCSPIINNSSISGGWAAAIPTAVQCLDGAACVVTNSIINAGSTAYQRAISCSSGGCGLFSGNLITGTTLPTLSSSGWLIAIDQSNPTFENNEIVGPACPSQLSGSIGWTLAHIEDSAPVFTNNVFRDQPCLGRIEVIRVENAGPILRNNTIQFATCPGCGLKYGLFVNGSTSTAIARNNIFFNAGTREFANGFAVYEANAASDLQFFENNALWAPNGGTLYFDEGSSALLLPAINALSGSTGNISADPMLDATFHLLPNSPCRNAGTATGAPALDFDGNSRPQEMVHDIGADEYVP